MKQISQEEMAEVKARAKDLVNEWLDEITDEGRQTGDFNTPLCVYLSAARHLLDKAEMAAKQGGGGLVAYYEEIKGEGN